MKRTAPLFAILVAAALATPARADEAQPTPEQLAAAKQAFQEGNALFKAGKLEEAVEKLKESFRLSRNAFLLYNIGHTYDQLGRKDLVLFYYRKFLANAPANAPMRDNVAKRVAELEAENVQASTPDDEAATATVAAPAPPTSKFGKADFKHEQVFTVPPGNPVDIAAFVPQESGFTVKLFYRASGEAQFAAKPMTWRNMELVARIPAPKVTGNSIQYYLEVRDAAGQLVTRSGKATSPNLVNIERGAKPQYYADFVDEGGEVFIPVVLDETKFGDSNGQTDVQPTGRFGTAKWITTGVSAGLLGTSLVTYLMAGKQHDKLVRDAHDCGTPPCREFDAEFGQKVEDLGRRYDLVYKVTLGVGAASAVVAGYFWYRDMKSRKRRDATSTTATMRWLVPAIGEGYAGASAGVRF